MLEVVGEVCDGLFITPFNTREYVLSKVIPGVERGLAKSGRDRSQVEICCQTIVMIGSNDVESEAARNSARAKLAFHLTLPAYQTIIDLQGWGDFVARARQLQAESRWSEIEALVSDDMLDLVSGSRKPASVAATLRERNDFADRTGLVIYNETEDGALTDLVHGLKSDE